MTNSLKYILICTLMLMGQAYGQEKFLGLCEKPDPTMAYEIKILKAIFKVNTCQEIAQKISGFKSYNEFFIPLEIVRPRFMNSWTKALPHLLGIKAKLSIPSVRGSLPLVGPGLLNIGSPFERPEIYSEFKNLKVIDFTARRFKKSECDLLKELPHIETVLTDMVGENSLTKCRPYSKLPDIIILGDYVLTDDLEDGFRNKIIGIEYFVNFSRELISLPRLRYLGVSYPFKESDYKFLVQNQNITHLSLNSSSSLTYATVLGELPNLSFLALSCLKTTSQDPRAWLAQDSPEYCENANLKNVKFLKNLKFLKEIVLDWEGLEDISTLDALPSLETRSHPFVP